MATSCTCGAWGEAFRDSALKYMADPGFGIESYLGPELTARFSGKGAPVAILGPSITVACQNTECRNHGIAVTIHSELIGNGRVVSTTSWSHLTCAACGQVPKQLQGD